MCLLDIEPLIVLCRYGIRFGLCSLFTAFKYLNLALVADSHCEIYSLKLFGILPAYSLCGRAVILRAWPWSGWAGY